MENQLTQVPIEGEAVEIKIYDMDNSVTWIAAANPNDAIRAFAMWLGFEANTIEELNASDFDEYYPDVLDEMRPLSPEEYNSLTFRKDAFDTEDDEEQVITFREHLDELIARKTAFPCFFATSEY